MTTISDDYRSRSAVLPTKQFRIPVDFVAVALWSLVGLMFCAFLATSSYTPDLPVIMAMASG